MTTRNIDDQLRQYYAGAALAPASLERLRGVLATSAKARADERKESRSAGAWQLVAIAASISIVFLAAAVMMLRKPGGDVPKLADSGLSERLAEEAARRHAKCIEETPFRAEDLPGLLAQMNKVDFAAGVPARRGLGSMKVRGAHYCVLDGQIAIHVVLVDETGSLVSLFETKAGTNMASLREASHTLDHTDVELWQERGVLYATAFTAPTT
ncbi:MAG: hypothetical protein WC538_15770 [Thermoanaerobaculia bacterium]|jgi:hypothetical protein